MRRKKRSGQFFREWWFIILYLIFYLAVINLVVYFRYRQYEVYYFDHGLFDQSLWNVASFKPPEFDYFKDKPISQLGDHFGPAMYLVSPLYWFTSSYSAIFFLENIFIAASAFVLFLTAKGMIRNKLLIFSILVAFTLFLGLQNTVIANFHPELPALFTLALTLFFMQRRKWGWYYFCLITTLAFKEYFASIGFALGLFLIFEKKWKHAAVTLFYSLAYYCFATRIAAPFFAHGSYSYLANMYSPGEAAKQLFFPWVKTRTMVVSFLTFGLLPFLAPSFLPVIIQDYLVRFVLTNTSARLDLGLHYNALVSVLLAHGAVLGASKLEKYGFSGKIASCYAAVIIAIALIFHLKLHGPLGLAFNRAFYIHTREMKFLDEFVGRIPGKGLVMTQNNFAPRLTHTHKVILLRMNYWEVMPEVIAVDIRKGQNPNNFWPVPEDQFEQMYRMLLEDPNYQKEAVTEEQVLFLKREKIDPDWYLKFRQPVHSS